MVRDEKLENVYQDVASLISNSLHYKILDKEYPKLVIKRYVDNQNYEIIVRKTKEG